MPFLPLDDHMLIMNVNTYMYNKHGTCASLTDEDLSRLRDIGAQTVVQYAQWAILAEHGWGYLDTAVALARKHGLRCMIDTYCMAAANLPKAWYSWKPDGMVGVAKGTGGLTISLWNMEAHTALFRHIGEIVNRYPGGDVAVVFTGRGSGETVLLNDGFYDPAALASHAEEVGGRPDRNNPETKAWVHRAVVAYYTKFDGALLHHHNQTWNAISPPALKNNECGGIGAQEDIFAAEYELWPDADRYLMQYTYWRNTKNGYRAILDGWREKYKLQMIVEADHCTGLPRTAPLAIAARMRGQIVGPVHPCAGTLRLEQEHIDAIAAAIRLWEQADEERKGEQHEQDQ